MTEDWRPVVGFEGRYEVSSLGRVASVWSGTGRLLAVVIAKRGGYPTVMLWKANKQYARKIHQLVCEAFNGPRPPGTQVRHLDGNPQNNTPSNLQWGSGSENMFDRVAHGRHFQTLKTHCKNGHPLEGENLRMRGKHRLCVTCQRASKRKYARAWRASQKVPA